MGVHEIVWGASYEILWVVDDVARPSLASLFLQYSFRFKSVVVRVR